jgi:catechol 2,3-dioxygenase-like lactoylglutathione lyase family enzyme
MITGTHALIYAEDADAARAFFRDVLGRPGVDAGGGWLICSLPPAELGIHPAGGDEAPSGTHRISLMCDDIEQTIAELEAKGVEFTGPVRDQGYGLVATMVIPGGAKVDLYEPRHPVAYDLGEP